MGGEEGTAVGKRKKSREDNRSNAATIQDAVSRRAANWALDEDVLDALPAGDKARLIMQFLPKAQLVDQDLDRDLLRLTELLRGVPDVMSLTEELVKLRGRLAVEQAKQRGLDGCVDKWASWLRAYGGDLGWSVEEVDERVRKWCVDWAGRWLEAGRALRGIEELGGDVDESVNLFRGIMKGTVGLRLKARSGVSVGVVEEEV